MNRGSIEIVQNTLRASTAFVALAVIGCSHHEPPPQTARNVSPAVTAEVAPLPPPTEEAQAFTVSKEIQEQCALPHGAENVPRFAFDEADLRPRGQNILDDVAECMTSGNLKEHTITIVGRADPRGSHEYNVTLGRSRAEAARAYLAAHGVPSDRLVVKSRGEAGATGTDESSWALDRRVDLTLGSGDEVGMLPAQGAANSLGAAP